MTTSTRTQTHAEIVSILARRLPQWASKLQAETLAARFLSGYDFGWIVGGGWVSGGAHSERGAARAIRREARDGQWTCVVPLREIVDAG